LSKQKYRENLPEDKKKNNLQDKENNREGEENIFFKFQETFAY